MFEVLRSSNVPLTWMLVQGILFAGLTMLVTARTGLRALTQRAGLPFLLVDLPAWTRQCSVCLAIMTERWSEELLPKLDSQFEALANDTLRLISSSAMNESAANRGPRDANVSSDNVNLTRSPSTRQGPEEQDKNPRADDITYPAVSPAGDWDYFEAFREFLGISDVQTFWDAVPHDGDIGIAQSRPPNEASTQDYLDGSAGDILSTWT